jgi:hypothetical protein
MTNATVKDLEEKVLRIKQDIEKMRASGSFEAANILNEYLAFVQDELAEAIRDEANKKT